MVLLLAIAVPAERLGIGDPMPHGVARLACAGCSMALVDHWHVLSDHWGVMPLYATHISPIHQQIATFFTSKVVLPQVPQAQSSSDRH